MVQGIGSDIPFKGQKREKERKHKLIAGAMDIPVREMTVTGYDQIYGLWTEIKSFGIGSIDDSWDGVERFLRRNPTISVAAVQSGHMTGDILCGHDGKTSCFYHVCVAPEYKKHGIGYHMVRFAVEALQKEGISKVSLVVFKENEVGNAFWQGIGWREWEDMNTYEFILNEENITRFVR